VRGQTGNGAEFWHFCSARECVAGVRNAKIRHFRRIFFGSFFGRSKKEHHNNFKTKKVRMLFKDEIKCQHNTTKAKLICQVMKNWHILLFLRKQTNFTPCLIS